MPKPETDYNLVLDPEDIPKFILQVGFIFAGIAAAIAILFVVVQQNGGSTEDQKYLLNMILATLGIFGAALVFWGKYS